MRERFDLPTLLTAALVLTTTLASMVYMTTQTFRENAYEYATPANMAECMTALDRILPDIVKKEMKSGGPGIMLRYHHGLGTWIRNNWGLWKESKLKEYFLERGICHPDGMSASILSRYWDYLKGNPTRFPGTYRLDVDNEVLRKRKPCPKSTSNNKSTRIPFNSSKVNLEKPISTRRACRALQSWGTGLSEKVRLTILSDIGRKLCKEHGG